MSIPAQKIYNTFDAGKNTRSLSALCLDLLFEQKRVWPELRKGYGLLKSVREREVLCRGFSVLLQHNPGRIKSSLAVVNKASGAEQPCFLCLDRLPDGQKGVLYRNEFLILCNPMPVLPFHFTVSHLDHLVQAIAETIDTFLHLAADFSSGWVVLYNGPQCGASAPNHLHFQVVPSGKMPIEQDVRKKNKFLLTTEADNVLLYRAKGLGREVILLEGNDRMAVGKAFKNYMNGLKKGLPAEKEPMINMAGWYEECRWHLMIFPRRKHRPDAFFKQGEERLVVSPGVIDMGGVLITPVEKDFERLDRTSVESIYKEVSLEKKKGEKAIHAIAACSTGIVPH